MKNNEEPIKNIDSGSKWQFWFIVSFSLFLIVTFVYFLPLRFKYEALTDEIKEEGGMHEDGAIGAMEGAHGDGETISTYEEAARREGLAVNLNISPAPLQTGVPARFDFFINQKPGNIPIPVTNISIDHSKFMHVVGIRDDLNEFFHIHPEPISSPGFLNANYVFPEPGFYKIWSEIKKDNISYIFSHPKIYVAGTGETFQKQISFEKNVIVDKYQVALKLDEPIAKGHEHALAFDVHTLAGNEVELEDYLAVQMHLAVLSEDLKEFIHTHPEGDGHMSSNDFAKKLLAHVEETTGETHEEDENINFHVVFPKAGLYKVFAQFRPKGAGLIKDQAISAGFWVKVEDELPAIIQPKVYYIISSLILLAILSWLTGRYVRRSE